MQSDFDYPDDNMINTKLLITYPDQAVTNPNRDNKQRKSRMFLFPSFVQNKIPVRLNVLTSLLWF